MSKEILRDPGHSEDDCPRVAIRMGCYACSYPDSEAMYPAPDFPYPLSKDNKWEMGTDQEAMLELGWYEEINEVIRKFEGEFEDDWENIGLDNMRIMAVNKANWKGYICFVVNDSRYDVCSKEPISVEFITVLEREENGDWKVLYDTWGRRVYVYGDKKCKCKCSSQ